MAKKWIFVAGAGIGYVLGTRAGREKYNAMAAQAKEFLDKPAVKEATGVVQGEATRLYGEGRHLLRDRLRQLHVRGADDATVRNTATTRDPAPSPLVADPFPPTQPGPNGLG